MARLVGAFGRRTIIMRLMLVALCMSAASAQATGEPCQTRSQPVGVSIEVTVDVHDERESSRSILDFSPTLARLLSRDRRVRMRQCPLSSLANMRVTPSNRI